MNKKIAIIEIGSTNTKNHIYQDTLLFESSVTIELKKHYQPNCPINDADKEQLYKVIKDALKYTSDVHIYGCSIFRKMTKEELDSINEELKLNFNLEIEVVTQEDESYYTALGCYKDIDYPGVVCIFIGGGGSTELIFVKNKEIIAKKYFPFGVGDITNKFPSLSDDIPNCTFKEVYDYIDGLVGDIDIKADILVLAGGDHLYWYNNALYQLDANNLYQSDSQKFMISIANSDKYDEDALVTSLDAIRNRSDNPGWFDGSRAMKVTTNLISHKIDAKYIIPTKINMEDGLKKMLEKASV